MAAATASESPAAAPRAEVDRRLVGLPIAPSIISSNVAVIAAVAAPKTAESAARGLIATTTLPPTRPPASRAQAAEALPNAIVAGNGLNTGFVAADGTAGSLRRLSEAAVDAVLAETDSSTTVDISLVDLLARAMHRRRLIASLHTADAACLADDLMDSADTSPS